MVVVDTGAVRAEYGDAGLGPVFEFLRERVPEARLSVRPTAGRSAISSRRRPARAFSCCRTSSPACVDAVAAACGCE